MEIQTGFPILQISAEKTKASGSLEYMGRCDGSPDFPNVHAPRNGGGPPLEIFRDVFSKDPMMRVKQDTSGKIRMVEADVPGDLLDVKIGHISFAIESPQRTFYSPGIALHMILATPEVTDFTKRQNIGPLEKESFELPGDSFGSDQPRVSGDLDNVTVSQALDYVVQTYYSAQGHPSFWAYKSCSDNSGGRRVFSAFFEIFPPCSQSEPLTPATPAR